MRNLKHLRKSCTSDECLYTFVFKSSTVESQTDVVHLFLEEAKELSVCRLDLFWQEGVDNWNHFTGNLYMDQIDLVEVSGNV